MMSQKTAFEWASPRIPHTEDAIRVTQYVANFLVRLGHKICSYIILMHLILLLTSVYRIDILINQVTKLTLDYAEKKPVLGLHRYEL